MKEAYVSTDKQCANYHGEQKNTYYLGFLAVVSEGGGGTVESMLCTGATSTGFVSIPRSMGFDMGTGILTVGSVDCGFAKAGVVGGCDDGAV